MAEKKYSGKSPISREQLGKFVRDEKKRTESTLVFTDATKGMDMILGVLEKFNSDSRVRNMGIREGWSALSHGLRKMTAENIRRCVDCILETYKENSEDEHESDEGNGDIVDLDNVRPYWEFMTFIDEDIRTALRFLQAKEMLPTPLDSSYVKKSKIMTIEGMSNMADEMMHHIEKLRRGSGECDKETAVELLLESAGCMPSLRDIPNMVQRSFLVTGDSFDSAISSVMKIIMGGEPDDGSVLAELSPDESGFMDDGYGYEDEKWANRYRKFPKVDNIDDFFRKIVDRFMEHERDEFDKTGMNSLLNCSDFSKGRIRFLSSLRRMREAGMTFEEMGRAIHILAREDGKFDERMKPGCALCPLQCDSFAEFAFIEALALLDKDSSPLRPETGFLTSDAANYTSLLVECGLLGEENDERYSSWSQILRDFVSGVSWSDGSENWPENHPPVNDAYDWYWFLV